MTKLIPTLCLSVALALGAASVSAKPIGKIIREIGLTPDDFSILSDTGKSLYTAQPPRPGKVVSWTNPDSRSHGKAKLAAMRGNCAFMQHIVYPQGAKKSKEIRLRVCKNAEGKWLLQP